MLAISFLVASEVLLWRLVKKGALVNRTVYYRVFLDMLNAGTPTLGGKRESCPFFPLPWGAGGARIALCAALFPSLISCEGAFSGVVDSLMSTNFSGGKPPDPQVNVVQL